MRDEMKPALDMLTAQLQEQLAQVKSTKLAINAIYKATGDPAPHTDIDEGPKSFTIQKAQFYGQPLATNVRSILEMRRSAGLGVAASVNEIYQALLEGGYKFDAKDDDNAKTGLRQSMRKNQIFHRIPTGEWGLLSWFPNAKIEKDKDDEPENEDDTPEEKKPGERVRFTTQKTATDSVTAVRVEGTKKKSGEGNSANDETASTT